MDATQIIQKLGGTAAVARVTGVKYHRAFDWSRRKRIPADYWHMLIEYAASQEDCPITFETLMQHASPRRSGMKSGNAA